MEVTCSGLDLTGDDAGPFGWLGLPGQALVIPGISWLIDVHF